MPTLETASSPKAIREFIELPARIYAGFPGYEPPLQLDRAMLLDPKQSAFWKRARARYWLARKGGRLVGRISAQIDPITPVGVEAGSGMFGCLDAVDDPAVVQALITAAAQWLADEGCVSMFGPCTLDMNDEPGLLIDGADQAQVTLCPWHPPYLALHMEKLGFTKLHDLHNWRLDLLRASPATADARLRLAERIPGLKVRHPARKTYARDIQILCDVYNDGWRDNWGFIPLTPVDLAGLDQLMKWLVPREGFKIVELHGKPVAVLLLIPNLFELTSGLGAKPTPTGWVKLLWRAARHRFRSGRITIAGVSHHLQGTVIGAAIAALLVDELIAGQASLKGEWVEAGWVLESNDALIRILERFSFRRNKTFRIYSRNIVSGALPLAAGAFAA